VVASLDLQPGTPAVSSLEPGNHPRVTAGRSAFAPSVVEADWSLLFPAVKGFTWGSSPAELLSFLSPSHAKFDLILLSDLVFNHNQHAALLDSCLSCLSSSPPLSPAPAAADAPATPEIDLSSARARQGPLVLCFFSHHRPWLVEADLGILKVAEDKGWKVEKVWEDTEAGVS